MRNLELVNLNTFGRFGPIGVPSCLEPGHGKIKVGKYIACTV